MPATPFHRPPGAGLGGGGEGEIGARQDRDLDVGLRGRRRGRRRKGVGVSVAVEEYVCICRRRTNTFRLKKCNRPPSLRSPASAINQKGWLVEIFHIDSKYEKKHHVFVGFFVPKLDGSSLGCEVTHLDGLVKYLRMLSAEIQNAFRLKIMVKPTASVPLTPTPTREAFVTLIRPRAPAHGAGVSATSIGHAAHRLEWSDGGQRSFRAEGGGQEFRVASTACRYMPERSGVRLRRK